MRILITGGCGYLGGRLAQFLSARSNEYEITLGSRDKCRSALSWLPGGEIVHIQWDSISQQEEICTGIDVIVHLAGMNAQDSKDDPVAALEFNAVSTAHLLRAAIKKGVKRFIYLSSAHVYGSPLIGNITEDTCPGSLHPYASSHRAGEDIVLAAHQRGEIEGVAIRLSNAFGAPSHKDVNCWMLLANDLCYQAVTSQQMILRSSGRQRRDFITLTDTCRAIKHFIELSHDKLSDGLYNVGGSWSPTILEMTQLIGERIYLATGNKPSILYKPNGNIESPEVLNYGVNKLLETGFTIGGRDNIEHELDELIEFCIQNDIQPYKHTNEVAENGDLEKFDEYTKYSELSAPSLSSEQKVIRILVVGGNGFIGRHVVNQANSLGWSVTSLSLSLPRPEQKLPGVHYVATDITVVRMLKDTLANFSFEYVINCGGYIDHILFFDGGRNIIDTHFSGVLNLVEVLDRRVLKSFINIGSSDEYGNSPAPQLENQREIPISPYSMGKVASTHFLQMLHRTENYPATTLRLFLTYGSGQDSRRFLPQIILGCLKNESFPTSKGDQVRDFCYIQDTVEAVFTTFLNNSAHGKVINIASGQPVTIRQVIETIQRLIGGGEPEYEAIPYRPNENMNLFANIQDAKQILGWEPKISMEMGLKRTIDWIRKHP